MTAKTNQEYLNEVLEKFRNDPEDETLSVSEKVLLSKVIVLQQEFSELAKQLDALNAEVRERREKTEAISQQLIHKQGQNQGFIDSLLALRSE